MRVLREGDLEILVPSSALAVKFDADPSVQARSGCGIKSVDFVVAFNRRVCFIEVKDPAHPKAPPENYEAFVQQAKGKDRKKDRKLSHDLVQKYKDSLLLWFGDNGGFSQHERVYLVLIAGIEKALLGAILDDLQRRLKPGHPCLVQKCLVLNEESWNREVPRILPGSSVRRVSG